ncbi:hypothetical protein C8J57DRAFT_980430, partial [Mycena rebaudengoi]
PPHCTHILQGLDVVCFSCHKRVWNEELRNFEEVNQQKVGKGGFTGMWGKAFTTAFTPAMIKAAFHVTGIYPFNPNAIKPEQMQPAEATSTKRAFPLLQLSPVCAVMAAFHHQPPTAFDVDPDTHAPSAVGGSATAPATPIRDPNIDPVLYTPSKRMCIMTSTLSHTSSGSFLVSSSKVTSQSVIPALVLEGPP